MNLTEYYVFQTAAEAQACIDAIEASENWPITPMRMGVPDWNAQKTVKWVDSYRELLTGEFAVLRIPEHRLDNCGDPYESEETDEQGNAYKIWKYPGVPQEDRDTFMAAFGQDIRELSESDLVPIEED